MSITNIITSLNQLGWSAVEDDGMIIIDGAPHTVEGAANFLADLMGWGA